MTLDLRMSDAGLALPVNTPQTSLRSPALVQEPRNHGWWPIGAFVVTSLVIAIVLTWSAISSVSPRDCNRYNSCALATLIQLGTPE